MGILKNREELLPVTCAILKDDDRNAFFSKLRKSPGGKPENLAKLLGIPQSVITEWTLGQSNIPYHTLQRIAHEFGVEMPPIAELRRESLPVIMSAPPPISMPPPKAGKRSPNVKVEREREPRRSENQGGRRRQKQQRQPKQQQAKRRQPQQQQSHQQQQKQRPPKAQQPHQQPQRQKKGGLPDFSPELAYWVGTLLAGAKMVDGAVVFSADRRIGQNFAAIWARETRKIFGISPQLISKEEGRIQEAVLPVTGLEEFLSKLNFPSTAAATTGESPSQPAPSHGGLPRWVWSNPEWKKSCVKGLIDASAHFQRTPSLSATLSPALSRALQKILHTFGVQAHATVEGGIVLEGKDLVKKYYDTLGSDNPKLRDQLQSFFRHSPRSASETSEPTDAITAITEESQEPQALQTAEPTMDSAPMDSAQAPENSDKKAETPKPKRPHFRKKRTVYRGKPNP